MFLKKRVYWLFALVLILQSSGLLWGSQPTPKPTKLKVLLLPFLTSSPFFIAEEERYFAEQGLEAEFIQLEKGAHAIPALVKGDLDVVGAGLSFSILNAIAKGARIRFVAEKGYIAPSGCGFTGLMARRTLVESGELNSLHRLKNRRVAVDTTNFQGYYMEKFLKTVDLTFEDIKIMDVPDPVLSEAFKKETIDLAPLSEPWVTRVLQNDHAVFWRSAQEVIPNFQFAFILYGFTLLDKNPDAGNRFMVAYLKAVRQYHQGKTDRNLMILSKYTGLEKELLKKACWPAFLENGQVNTKDLLDFQAWGMKRGLLDREVSSHQFLDSRFVEYAHKALSRAVR